MPDYIKEAFGRMNLHQIRSFLLYGTDDFVEEVRPYKDRLKSESDPIYRRLEGLYPDENELDKAAASGLPTSKSLRGPWTLCSNMVLPI